MCPCTNRGPESAGLSRSRRGDLGAFSHDHLDATSAKEIRGAGANDAAAANHDRHDFFPLQASVIAAEVPGY